MGPFLFVSHPETLDFCCSSDFCTSVHSLAPCLGSPWSKAQREQNWRNLISLITRLGLNEGPEGLQQASVATAELESSLVTYYM